MPIRRSIAAQSARSLSKPSQPADVPFQQSALTRASSHLAEYEHELVDLLSLLVAVAG